MTNIDRHVDHAKSRRVQCHGDRNDFVVGGTRANYTEYISIKIYTIYAGSVAEPQPTKQFGAF